MKGWRILMLAHLLSKIRKDLHRSKSSIAAESNLDSSYISYVENQERIPSHNALKKICTSMDVPYQQIMYTYDKLIPEDLLKNDFLNLVPYNSVVAIDSFDNLIRCPAKFGSSSFAIRVADDSMEPNFLKGSYAYVEQNSPILPKEAGLFYYNGEFFIRRFFVTNSAYSLRPDNSNYKPLRISKSDELYAIGKIIGTTNDF